MTRDTVAFMVLTAVMSAAWWAMAGGLEWTHLQVWMGPGLRP
ncbi:hypothetical protein [Rhodoplanes roseus]|nr:hypothetical protein [Rhodoplanes roseus]